MELVEKKDMEEVVVIEMKNWFKLLLNLVDITGDNPAQHLKPFIRGKEKVIKKYREVSQEHVSEDVLGCYCYCCCYYCCFNLNIFYLDFVSSETKL